MFKKLKAWYATKVVDEHPNKEFWEAIPGALTWLGMALLAILLINKKAQAIYSNIGDVIFNIFNIILYKLSIDSPEQAIGFIVIFILCFIIFMIMLACGLIFRKGYFEEGTYLINTIAWIMNILSFIVSVQLFIKLYGWYTEIDLGDKLIDIVRFVVMIFSQ